MNTNKYSQEITVFHNRTAPESGILAGYGAIIAANSLNTPIPDKLAIISKKHKRYSTDDWNVFTPRHAPGDTLEEHLVFALKYEGVDLSVLKSLFVKVPSNTFLELIKKEPTSQYTRRIWFLYEWLTDKKLELRDLKTGNYVDALDAKIQYPGPSKNSSRHRVRDNLPGVRDFCPLIRKTEKLDSYIESKLNEKAENSLNAIHRDVIMRTAAFLLLKDSKASYAIEGESPPQNRMQRWGKAIGQAGNNELSKDELLRLQQIVIENARFIKLGWRDQGGFVGEHDRTHGTPIPDHISAKWEDLETLLDGLIETNNKLQNSDFDPVLMATIIAFGFVLIHPFVDGNGRIHRYLIHHVLAKRGFAKKNLIFPVSAAIVQRIPEYKEVYNHFTETRIDLIEWKPTPDNNVEVLNDTIDLYRYFDATRMAEFLYSCVEQTIDEIIPDEVEYLRKYDEFKYKLEQSFEMPDKMVALLVRFLVQENGVLSKRAKDKEFGMLSEKEIKEIENLYSMIFV
jgi:hypothetical protein